jgi:hypothetical protein
MSSPWDRMEGQKTVEMNGLLKKPQQRCPEKRMDYSRVIAINHDAFFL